MARAAIWISRTKRSGAERMGKLWVEHLQGDRAVVLDIARNVDVAMPPRPSSRSILY